MATKLEIWIDGDCAVCRRSQRWCTARDHEQRLNFRDLRNEHEAEPPGDGDAMRREVHVRRADGSVATGFDAWLLVLAELPGWSRFAAIAGWPAVRRFGPLFYAIIARWRHRIPG